jgi:fumarate reductase subunit C
MKVFEQLNRSRRGMTAIDLVYFAIIVIIGVSIFSGIDQSITTTGMTAAGAAAKGNVSANTYAGFQTIASAPVVIAAVVIIGIVSMLMARK